MKKTWLLSALMTFSLGAFAQSGTPVNCRDKANELCPMEGHEKMKCMKEKKDQMPAECKEKMMEKHPCMGQMHALCPMGDRKEKKACIEAKKAELPAECQEKMEKMKGHMKAWKEACHEDSEKFCKDVKPGKGAKIKCLKDNEAQLSAGCKEMLEKAPKKGGKRHHQSR